MPDRFLHQYEILFKKANADLKLATHALTIEEDEIDLEIIFFHLQQAAEKYLKTLLAFSNVHFEKIHDIKRLLDMCKANGIEFPGYATEFVELNPYAVEGRYAIIADDMGDAQKYVDLLQDFKGYVSNVLVRG